MTRPLLVADVAGYLAGSGWRRTPQSWRGAGIWVRDGVEVLVPTRDDLGDNPARIRDVVRAVAAVEDRSVDDVVRDVDRPLVDATTLRSDAGTTLPAGLSAVTGLRDMLVSAARVVLEGPHLRFARRPPAAVAQLLARTQLTADAGSGFTLLTPVGAADGGPRGRDVAVQLHDATTAVRDAVLAADVDAFDDTVTAGVSAEFCAAVSALTGPRHDEPFELGFRWAHAERSELPARSVSFPPGSGVLLRSASRRLRRSEVSGPAVVVGRVDGLHDEEGGADRWRARVRGELYIGRPVGPRRAIWVRLPGQYAYERALEAYRAGIDVRARGALSSRDGRVELSTSTEGIEIVQNDGPEDDRAR